MKSLGFSIKKGELRFCAVTGSKAQPKVVFVDRERFKVDQSRRELVDYFKQIFTEVITKHTPDMVGYRLSIEAKRADQVAYLCFPFGILNLICHERNVTALEFTHQSFTAKLLGHPGKKFDVCDQVLGTHGNHWDDEQRLAALSAWMSLK